MKKCAAGQIFYKKFEAGKTYQTKRAAGQIFWPNPDG